MTAEQLRHSLLQEAISGRLVPQDPNDEPASALLARIREEKERLIKEKKLKKEKPSAPITEDEIPYEIPATWEWVRISDICSIVNGFTPRRTEPKFWTNGTINWFTVEDINKQGEIIRYTEQKITKAATSEDRIVRPGSVLLCCTASVGRCAITEVPVTTNQQFNALTVKDEYRKAVSDTYILTIAKTLEPTLHQLAGQTTFEFVSVTKVGNIVIPIPPLAEQARIVAKLDEVLPIVEQYGKAQIELDELNAALPARLRQSILQEAISGKLVPQDENDEPASALLERVQLEKQKLVKEKVLKAKNLVVTPIPEDELPFDIPETWSWCRLGELAFERMGKTPPRGESEYWLNAKYPWVSISDMKDYGHIKTTKEGVSEFAAQKAFRQISTIGSLLMSFKLTVGRTAILDIDAYHNEAIITIQPYVDREYAFRNYLFYVLPLLANLGDSKDAIKGKTLNSTSLYNLYIPLPPLAEQQRIVAKIEELFAEIDKLK